MRYCLLLLAGCAVFSGCAGPKERLAKCSADENPVGLAAYAGTTPQRANPLTDHGDCGPMRPVNGF